MVVGYNHAYMTPSAEKPIKAPGALFWIPAPRVASPAIRRSLTFPAASRELFRQERGQSIIRPTPKEPKAPSPAKSVWAVYYVGKRQEWITNVEAESEAAAVEIVAQKFAKYPRKLIALLRR
jgi:hypothetical protein